MNEPQADAGVIRGIRVRALRQRRGLTQGQLAIITAIPRTTISGIERGAVKLSSGRTLLRLAQALRVPPEELLHDGDRLTPGVRAVREQRETYGWAPDDADLAPLFRAVDELPAEEREMVKAALRGIIAGITPRQRRSPEKEA